MFEQYLLSVTAKERILRKKYSSPKVNPVKTGALNTKNNSGQLSLDSGTTLISYESSIFSGEIALQSTSQKVRRLTETECERLQTVPDGYTAHVSDTQRYRMLGNGWTVDVVAYIFSKWKNT